MTETKPESTRRAVVIGGGIAGLTAAFDLQRAGWQVEVHEADGRWGGKILSSPVGDRLVDAGPDTFLARVEPGRRLCADLGIASELTSPVAPVPAYLVRDGKLHELPSGSMLGVPTDLDALAHSSLISAEGVERARAEETFSSENPHGPLDGDSGGDVSVGEVCRARLGDEITDLLIDPLLGGINASDIDRLSLAAGAPLLAAALERSPSLIEGLRQIRPSSGPTLGTAGNDPVFFGLPGGIARIIEALVEALENPGPHPPATLRLNSPIRSLDEIGNADAVIVAVPAYAASELLLDTCPEAAAELAAIDYASVAQVTMELPRHAVEQELDASGILFPRVGGTLITACTWFSTKWAHYQRPNTVLIRMTSGRFGDDRPAELSDAELTATLRGELSEVLPVKGEPNAVRVHHWARALPQYTPGHLGRVERIGSALTSEALHIKLVGAAYEGIGIPACIQSARSAAKTLIDS